jgi:hypothetical protein
MRLAHICAANRVLTPPFSRGDPVQISMTSPQLPVKKF